MSLARQTISIASTATIFPLPGSGRVTGRAPSLNGESSRLG